MDMYGRHLRPAIAQGLDDRPCEEVGRPIKNDIYSFGVHDYQRQMDSATLSMKWSETPNTLW